MADRRNETCTTSGRDHMTPLERMLSVARFATTRVEHGEAIPQTPAELKEWAETTALGTLTGMLYCGGRQFLANRQEGTYAPPQAGLSGPQGARLIAEENTRRLLRLGNEMLRGGLRFGALTGLFYSVQLLSSVARNQRDMQDTINAALVTGGALGVTMPGSASYRLRSAVLGAALGGVVAVPASLLQGELLKLQPAAEGDLRHTSLSGGCLPATKEYKPEHYTLRKEDAVAAIIAQMQDSLQHSPSKDRERER